MTGAELARRFLEFSQGGNPPRAAEHDAVATLYGTDEVQLDYDSRTVMLPGLGLVQCPTLEKVTSVDWYATVPVEGVGMSFHMGRGDPYVAGPDNPLPTKGSYVMALPHSVMNKATAGMNRAQRRAMRKA